ncbi:NAD-dependent epimerase/dehydratase family protein [Desulfobaculum bizertense]|uniref:dTDP-glucose 4,6-dehydratase n=1 Tax=Desulfobaculum bizertense DSM 18034 TaxID=1121442 RepID=A0A1T4WYG3_9BACT|nr:NAD-dependent epimerase/dehydratase family protein [Desulfobaculum bizertense]SKA82423.1 dTDP-glucose 4,6-dehydratase [Desulfobaculum bizertense DSM 18034]
MSNSWLIPKGYSLFQKDLNHVLEHAESSLRLLQHGRVFISGASGLFGQWILENLLWARDQLNLDIEIFALSRNPASWMKRTDNLFYKRDGLQILHGDIINFKFPPPCSYIIHAASSSLLNPSHHLESACFGTRRICDFADFSNSKSVLITSSGGAYLGAVNQNIHHEWVEPWSCAEECLSKQSVYGEGKRFMELLAFSRSHNATWNAVAARCFAFVGPWLKLDANYAVGNFIKNALEGKPITVTGDGSPLRTYQYLSDLVIWILTILTQGKDKKVYNVGGNKAVSIKKLAEIVSNISPQNSEVNILEKPQIKAFPSAYLPDVSRAQTELGLQSLIDLEEGIRRTMIWNSLRSSHV